MRKWQILAHVCQSWRTIIFASPRRLGLQLSCTFETRSSVRTNLPFWPVTFPLTIDYPFFPTLRGGPGDLDNIVAAFEHPGRVHRIVIQDTGPFLAKVAAIMQKSFPALTHLDVEWKPPTHDYLAGFQLPTPGQLLDGFAPLQLQSFRLKYIAFLQLPTFLSSAHNLVTLKLKDISKDVVISAEVTVKCLAVLTRLTTLSITFYDYMSRSHSSESRPRADLLMRTTLPALTSFHYRGYCEYLEDFLALINTPQLHKLRIKYFTPCVMDIQATQLSRFIDRTPSLTLNQFRHAIVTFYPLAIYVQLRFPQECHQAQISMDIMYIQWIDQQVSCVADVLGQLVAMFSNVDHLSVRGDNVEPREMESTDWLPFFRLFQDVKALHLSGGVAAYFVSALEDATEEMIAKVFPALDLIWIDEEGRKKRDKPAGSIERFLSFRQLSGRPVTVVDTEDAFFEADRNPL
jgi:hypothetical protein